MKAILDHIDLYNHTYKNCKALKFKFKAGDKVFDGELVILDKHTFSVSALIQVLKEMKEMARQKGIEI
jgi:ATP-dependent DNA ligase